MAIAQRSTIRTLAARNLTAFTKLGFAPSKLGRFYRYLVDLTKGGVDILYLGDSHFRAYGTTSPDLMAIPNQVTRLLQAAWNPSGVIGGQGFIPAQWTWSSPPTSPAVLTNADLSGVSSRVMNGGGHCIVKLTSGGAAGSIAYSTSGCTDLEVVHLVKQGSAVTAAWTLTGGASGSGNLTISGSGAAVYGSHSLIASSLSPAASWTWTVTEPATDDLRFSGWIRYRNDYGAGIRGHNLAATGILLYDPSNNSGLYRADEPSGGTNTSSNLQANLDQWSSEPPTTSTAVGARRAGLVVIELITNDQGTYGNDSGTISAQTALYQSKLQSLVNAALARPSQPAVLLVIPPAPSGREVLYRQFKQAMLNVARATPHTTVLDLDSGVGLRTQTDLPAAWRQADGTHYTSEGLSAMAGIIAGALLAGRPD